MNNNGDGNMLEQEIPLQERLHREHIARRKRIAAKAVTDRPIRLLSASERAAAFTPKPKPVKPAVEFCFRVWLRRQCDLHPIKKQPWFWIEGEIDPVEELRPLSIERIQQVVRRAYSLNKSDLISPRRMARLVRARQIAMYLARMLTPKSLPEIGRRFGGRDHTTVLHGCRKIEAMLAHDEELAAEIEALKSELTGGAA